MHKSIPRWADKPYHSLDYHLKQLHGEKIYKLSIDGGFTCPNRDGTIDTRGCIFCSSGGSGEFATKAHGLVQDQIAKALAGFGTKKIGNLYIAYFQAYTNTYGELSHLRSLYENALKHPLIVGISIATRPDCLPIQVLELLKELKNSYPNKSIWIELGLQTIHEQTAKFIRRGYSLDIFESAVANLKQLDIPIIVHCIFGLPHETKDMMLETIHYLNQQQINGIKLQFLYVLKETDLGTYYLNEGFHIFSFYEYRDFLIEVIEHLSPKIVIHRLTGDGLSEQLIAPYWSKYKRDFFNSLHNTMFSLHSFQGKSYEVPNESRSTNTL